MNYLRAQWDRIAGGLCVAAGAVALALGWAGISRYVYPAAQLPYVISGGVVGLFLLGVGATLWLSADLRDEWRHLADMEERLETRLEALVAERLGR